VSVAQAILPPKTEFDKPKVVQPVGVRHFLREEVKENEIWMAGRERVPTNLPES
jgi:hypothetical protein